MSEMEVVIREVTKNVWCFSAPFNMWNNRIALGGRSTAIRLANGQLWVLASTPLTEGTKNKLAELGDVKYLIAGNTMHHLFLKEYRAAYPGATLIGPEALNAKKAPEGLQMDKVFSEKATEIKFGFEDEIEYRTFSGFAYKDVAFFHRPSKTALAADLLVNLPAREQYSQSKTPAPWFPAVSWLHPFRWVHKDYLWLLRADKAAMQRDARVVASWDFERFIPCHGDIVEKNAKKAWNEAYRHYL